MSPARSACPCRASNRSPERSAHDVDHLIDVLVGLAALRGRADTTLNVVLQHEDRQGVDRCTKRRRLLEDVDAVLLPLDHPGDAAHLAFHPAQAPHQLRLVLGVGVPEVLADSGAASVRVGRRGGLGWSVLHRGMILPRGMDAQCAREMPCRRFGVVGGEEPARLAPMDPLEPSFNRLGGAACGACGRPVPADRVRVLASRDDLSFAEVPCAPCGSVGLAIFVAGSAELDGPEGQPAGPAPISPDDVLDMHRFLAQWSGGLRALLAPEAGRDAPGSS